MMKPPTGTINHRMMLNYVGSPVLYFELEKDVKYTPKLQTKIKEYKIHYLEDKLGYKMEQLETIISHDDYEKYLTKEMVTR